MIRESVMAYDPAAMPAGSTSGVAPAVRTRGNQVVIDIGHPWEWSRESITNHFESPFVKLLDLPTTPRYRAWHKIGEGLRDLQMTCYRIEQIEYERAHA